VKIGTEKFCDEIAIVKELKSDPGFLMRESRGCAYMSSRGEMKISLKLIIC
jgi:hypothetical protein